MNNNNNDGGGHSEQRQPQRPSGPNNNNGNDHDGPTVWVTMVVLVVAILTQAQTTTTTTTATATTWGTATTMEAAILLAKVAHLLFICARRLAEGKSNGYGNGGGGSYDGSSPSSPTSSSYASYAYEGGPSPSASDGKYSYEGPAPTSPQIAMTVHTEIAIVLGTQSFSTIRSSFMGALVSLLDIHPWDISIARVMSARIDATTVMVRLTEAFCAVMQWRVSHDVPQSVRSDPINHHPAARYW